VSTRTAVNPGTSGDGRDHCPPRGVRRARLPARPRCAQRRHDPPGRPRTKTIREALRRLTIGYRVSQAVRMAATLRRRPARRRIARGRRIASSTGSHPGSLPAPARAREHRHLVRGTGSNFRDRGRRCLAARRLARWTMYVRRHTGTHGRICSTACRPARTPSAASTERRSGSTAPIIPRKARSSMEP
jgi:hypothetical protein